MTLRREPPWFWRWVRIPLRERFWYPLKRLCLSFWCLRCLLRHRWREVPGAHALHLICGRCGRSGGSLPLPGRHLRAGDR